MLKKLSQFIDNQSQTIHKPYSKNKAHVFDSFDFLSLIRAWPEIAGTKLAEHTIPLKNQNGTLILLSNHSAFANELSYMELPLKKKIFEKFPNLEKSILSIKFIVDTTYFAKQYEQFVTVRENIAQPTLHPYSPEFKRLKKAAEELFSDISDQEIKEKMISIYIQTIK